jgi:hypothetical protein
MQKTCTTSLNLKPCFGQSVISLILPKGKEAHRKQAIVQLHSLPVLDQESTVSLTPEHRIEGIHIQPPIPRGEGDHTAIPKDPSRSISRILTRVTKTVPRWPKSWSTNWLSHSRMPQSHPFLVPTLSLTHATVCFYSVLSLHYLSSFPLSPKHVSLPVMTPETLGAICLCFSLI